MAAYYVSKPGDQPPRKGPPIPGEDEAVACVPYVPWLCPSCGERSPRTYGQRGRVRYHLCSCGLRFRSIEIAPDQIGDADVMKQLL